MSPVHNIIYRPKRLEAMSGPLVQLYAIWSAKRGVHAIPSRDEITPRDIKPFLARVTLLRVIDSGNDFEFRIVGDALIQTVGMNFQGRKASELVQFRRLVDLVYRPVYQTATPVAFECQVEWNDGPMSYREILALPLGCDHRSVDHMLGMSVDIPPLAQAPSIP